MKFGFQRKTDLALRALDALRRSDGHLSGPDIAQQISTTTQFLPKVMSPLVRGGWVASGRGPGRGYRLAQPLDEISVLEIVDAIEGPTENGRCVLRDGPCSSDPSCPLHDVWSEVRRTLVRKLGELTVLDAITDGSTT